MERARRESAMPSQHQDGIGAVPRRLAKLKKLEKHLSMETRPDDSKEESFPAEERRINCVEESGRGRLVDQPRVSGGVGVVVRGGRGVISVREVEVQTSPQHPLKEEAEVGVQCAKDKRSGQLGHPCCCGNPPHVGGGAESHTCGFRVAQMTCRECGEKRSSGTSYDRNLRLLEAPSRSGTAVAQNLSSSQPTSPVSPPLPSKCPHQSFMGRTLLGKLTQDLDQEVSSEEKHGRALKESSLAEGFKQYSERDSKALPPHGGLALRSHASLSSDEGDEILGLSFVTADSSCGGAAAAASTLTNVRPSQPWSSSPPDTTSKLMSTRLPQNSTHSFNRSQRQNRKATPPTVPVTPLHTPLPPPLPPSPPTPGEGE